MDKPTRKSNIELLKIIAMFIICLSHVVNPIVYDFGLNSYFSNNPLNWLFAFIKNLGWLGDYLFITCSCYFLVGKKNINWRKMVLYFIESYLVFVVFWIVFSIFKLGVTKDLTISTFTAFILTDEWFVLIYIGFLALLPLLNLITNKISKKVHLIVIISSLIVTLALQVLILFDKLPFDSYYKFLAFIFLYFIIAYGKKYGSYLFMKEGHNKANLIISLVCIALWFGFIALFNAIGVKVPGLFSSPLKIVDFYSPLFYVLAISLFLWFKELNIKDSKIINFISSLSLIFYITHQNAYTKLFADQPLLDFANTHSLAQTFGAFQLAGLARFAFGVVVSIIFFFIIQKPLALLLSKINSKND